MRATCHCIAALRPRQGWLYHRKKMLRGKMRATCHCIAALRPRQGWLYHFQVMFKDQFSGCACRPMVRLRTQTNDLAVHADQ
eukprot:1156131-Pelagomonas_calceolata.AAC.4